jgi:hypothetical protein
MAQISKIAILPTSLPAAPNFQGLDTANVKTALLHLRKVANYVELWPALSVKKTIDLGTADYEMELELANDTFTAGATSESNWNFVAGSTNLTIASIVKDSDTQVTITFDTQVEWPQLTGSGVTLAELNPVMTVDLTADTFLSEVAAENAANWTISAGDTELTVASISYVDGNQVTIEFTGTAAAGTITVQAKTSCLTGGVASGVASYDVTTEVSTCTDAARLVAGDIVLTAKADAVTGPIPSGVCSIDLSDGSYTNTVAPKIFFGDSFSIAAVDPVMTITLNPDVFTTKSAAENVDNYTISVGDTGLTVASIEYVSDRVVDISFTGTVAAGVLSVAIAASALLGATAGVSASYTIEGAAWANLGTFTQEALEGSVEVSQYLPGDDLAGFVYEYAVPTGSTNIANINLINSSAFCPRYKSAVVYDFGDSENTEQTIYAWMVADV